MSPYAEMIFQLQKENQGMERKNRELEKELALAESYQTAFFRIGAEIAKAGCCDHPSEDDLHNPNRCTREHLLVEFLALKHRAKTGEGW